RCDLRHRAADDARTVLTVRGAAQNGVAERFRGVAPQETRRRISAGAGRTDPGRSSAPAIDADADHRRRLYRRDYGAARICRRTKPRSTAIAAATAVPL